MEFMMRIKDIQIGEIQIPLVTPFRTALRTVEAVDDIVIRVIGDQDMEGYGEAPPTAVITGDTKGSIRTAIQDFIAPALIGMELEDFDGVMRKLHSCILKNTSAKAAVDMALYDLYAKSLGKPLYKILGGNSNIVETDLTISVGPIDTMVADSLKAVQEGFRILKIKVGKEAWPMWSGSKPFGKRLVLRLRSVWTPIRDGMQKMRCVLLRPWRI